MKTIKSTLTPLVAALALLAGTEVSALCNPDVTITKPDRIYTNHGDGTVTDNESGLMWMQCTLGQSGSDCASGATRTYNWKQALEAAQTANAGSGTYGHTDWRVPNIEELVSLAEKGCYSPAINTTFFPNTANNNYWSASPFADSSVSAWRVYFNNGSGNGSSKSGNGLARLVRNTQ